MSSSPQSEITQVIGRIPYRMAFAGGWIDQPFVSQHNPTPPGSMVVVAIEPNIPFMDRCGMGTSTRKVALQIWEGSVPHREPADLVRELYAAENEGQPAPSGSQDMAGILYPGINRLDYDFNHEGGYFPVHIETNTDPEVAAWLEQMIYMVPIAQRPAGYDPSIEKHLDPVWISRLGQSGKDCFEAIIAKDAQGLGAAMAKCMLCWERILPGTVYHPSITLDLLAILAHYQQRYIGAMYSGSGGGYLYVIADEPVPGGGQVKVRV